VHFGAGAASAASAASSGSGSASEPASKPPSETPLDGDDDDEHAANAASARKPVITARRDESCMSGSYHVAIHVAALSFDFWVASMPKVRNQRVGQ
jgi:hypothetical protein